MDKRNYLFKYTKICEVEYKEISEKENNLASKIKFSTFLKL